MRTLILICAAAIVLGCCWAAWAEDDCCGGGEGAFCCRTVSMSTIINNVRHTYTNTACVNCPPGYHDCIVLDSELRVDDNGKIYVWIDLECTHKYRREIR